MKEVHISTEDGYTIPVHKWEDVKSPKAVCVISHGMVEHSKRYADLASVLNKAGIAVWAPDHRGHGAAIELTGKGHFADKFGWEKVTKDLCTVIEHASLSHPGLPLFLIGHSMGSLLARAAASVVRVKLSLVILSGTPAYPGGFMTLIGKFLSFVIGLSGVRHPSRFLTRLVFGSNTKRIPKPCSALAWLSLNPRNVEDYKNDPLCGFYASAGFFRDLFTGVAQTAKPSQIRSLAGKTDVAFLSGAEDPVGFYSLGVQKTANSFVKCGVKVVKVGFYPGLRHEIFNETEKLAIYQDVVDLMVPYFS